MRRSTFAVLTGSFAIALPAVVQAQMLPPQFVKVSAAAPARVAPGKPFEITVTVKVGEGFHIQGNPAAKDYLATLLSLAPSKGVKVIKIKYPKPLTQPFFGEKLPVYEKSVKIILEASVLKPGRYVLPLSLRYQGCNEKSCFPPDTLHFSVKTEAERAK